MSLPSVDIVVKDGALGRTLATDDGVAGLVVTGVAAAGLALNTPKAIFSLSDALDLGITAAALPHANFQITEFYDQAGEGAELWIDLVSEAMTAADVFVAVTGPMDKLLTAANGRITIAGCSMGRAAGYTATPTGILDYNIATVAAAAQALATTWTSRFSPLRIILDGTYLIDPLTGITSAKGAGDRVGVFVGVSVTGKKASSMGRFLGRLAAIPVHQSIAWVGYGAFCPEGFLTSGKAVESYSYGTAGQLHDAGYMTLRKFPGEFGAFVSDDLTLAAADSDFASLCNGRVIDKAIRLVYQAYVKEVKSSVEIKSDGTLLPTRVSYLEGVCSRPLDQRMLAEGNISSFGVYIDPKQNVLSTGKINIVVEITPLGYLDAIVINLGFNNPAL